MAHKKNFNNKSQRKAVGGIREKTMPVNNKISWCFSLVDLDGPYGWTNCNSLDKILQAHAKLSEYELKSFEELGAADCHSVPTANFSPDARKRLKKIKMEDHEELYSFRITGPRRIYCVQEHRVMKILWYDLHHKVYPCKQ